MELLALVGEVLASRSKTYMGGVSLLRVWTEVVPVEISILSATHE